MTRPTVNCTTPEQHYQMLRARSERLEAERNRAPLPFFVQRHSVVHGVIAGAAFAAMSMTASPPTLATDRYGRLPRSESVSIGCLTLT